MSKFDEYTQRADSPFIRPFFYDKQGRHTRGFWQHAVVARPSPESVRRGRKLADEAGVHLIVLDEDARFESLLVGLLKHNENTLLYVNPDTLPPSFAYILVG